MFPFDASISPVDKLIPVQVRVGRRINHQGNSDWLQQTLIDERTGLDASKSSCGSTVDRRPAGDFAALQSSTTAATSVFQACCTFRMPVSLSVPMVLTARIWLPGPNVSVPLLARNSELVRKLISLIVPSGELLIGERT